MPYCTTPMPCPDRKDLRALLPDMLIRQWRIRVLRLAPVVATVLVGRAKHTDHRRPHRANQSGAGVAWFEALAADHLAIKGPGMLPADFWECREPRPRDWRLRNQVERREPGEKRRPAGGAARARDVLEYGLLQKEASVGFTGGTSHLVNRPPNDCDRWSWAGRVDQQTLGRQFRYFR